MTETIYYVVPEEVKTWVREQYSETTHMLETGFVLSAEDAIMHDGHLMFIYLTSVDGTYPGLTKEMFRKGLRAMEFAYNEYETPGSSALALYYDAYIQLFRNNAMDMVLSLDLDDEEQEFLVDEYLEVKRG